MFRIPPNLYTPEIQNTIRQGFRQPNPIQYLRNNPGLMAAAMQAWQANPQWQRMVQNRFNANNAFLRNSNQPQLQRQIPNFARSTGNMGVPPVAQQSGVDPNKLQNFLQAMASKGRSF